MKKHARSVNSTDGSRLMTYTMGDKTKPALVFVHGYPDNHLIFDKLISYLVNDFHIICYDVRGAGRSDKPKKLSSYRLQQLSDDLWCVTTELLLDKPFHIVAHDWGSVQTWESVCQSRFKHKVLSFTSISGPRLAHINKILTTKSVTFSEKIKQSMRSWYVYWFHIPVLPTMLMQKIAKNWHIQQKLPKNPHQLSDAIYGRKLYQANIVPELKKSKRLSTLSKTICPVHMLVLTEDDYVSPIFVNDLATWIDDVTQTRLPYKHWAIYHQAETLAQQIRAYIQDKDG